MKKKFDRYTVITIISIAFLLCGLLNMSLIRGMGYIALQLVISGGTIEERFEKFVSDVKTTSVDRLSYHDSIIDFQSLLYRVSGQKVIRKGNGNTVVKLKDGALSGEYPYLDEAGVEEDAYNTSVLFHQAEKAGMRFLYIYAPPKACDVKYPVAADNSSMINYRRFKKSLEDKGVPFLDLYEKMKEAGLDTEKSYFATDHHWKPETGFWATGIICSELNRLYGYEYDPAVTDPDSYDVRTYRDWFLGSQGKNTGRLYGEPGVDDIDLITPRFATYLTESQPFYNEHREGAFERTALNMDLIRTKDHYGLSPYAAYCGGDFRLQIFENKLNPDGETFFIVRDSFANVVVPFLTLTAGEVHTADIRKNDWTPPERLDSVFDYAKDIDADYLLVLYNDVEDNTGCLYDFQVE